MFARCQTVTHFLPRTRKALTTCLRKVLTGASLDVPVDAGQLMLGTWQGIYLWEHRLDPHQRKVIVTGQGQ